MLENIKSTVGPSVSGHHRDLGPQSVRLILKGMPTAYGRLEIQGWDH